MSLGIHLERTLRRVAWRTGLVRDRTAAPAVHVERVLDEHARGPFVDSGAPGLVAVVRFAEGRTLVRELGSAGPGAPMRTSTVLPALSASKPITAACAIALVERGRLDLDEPIWRRLRSYRLPESACNGFDPDGVTLRGLLSHSAGVRLHGHGWSDTGRPASARELLDEVADPAYAIRLIGPPRASIRYAGGGYVLAELLMEEATGTPFAELARTLVLEPLGMTSSSFDPPPALEARLATSYDAEGRPLPARRLRSRAASGLFSTAEDLTRFWSSFVLGGAGEPAGRGVLSPEGAKAAISPQIRGSDGVAVGLGFYLRRRRGETRYSHVGTFEGWSVQVEGFVRRRVVVTILTNGDRGRACAEALAARLRRTIYERAC